MQRKLAGVDELALGTWLSLIATNNVNSGCVPITVVQNKADAYR